MKRSSILLSEVHHFIGAIINLISGCGICIMINSSSSSSGCRQQLIFYCRRNYSIKGIGENCPQFRSPSKTCNPPDQYVLRFYVLSRTEKKEIIPLRCCVCRFPEWSAFFRCMAACTGTCLMFHTYL